MTTGCIRLLPPIELASSQTKCWRCGNDTPVHSLLAGNVQEVEDGVVVNETERPTFVYAIKQDDLPADVGSAATAIANNFRPAHSRAMGEACWANVCSHCEAVQGAFFLHTEPDGPFFCEVEDFTGIRQPLTDRGCELPGGASFAL